jgi:hypothetical protein
VKCQLIRYECAACGFEFDEAEPREYAHRLLRSELEAHKAALLPSSFGPEIAEARRVLADLPEWRALGDRAQSEHFDHLVGIVVDPAPDGTPYRADALPTCPRCGSRRMRDAQGYSPARYVDCELPAATFSRWASQNPEQRAKRLREAFMELRRRAPLPPLFELSDAEIAARRELMEEVRPRWWERRRRRAAEHAQRSALRRSF